MSPRVVSAAPVAVVAGILLGDRSGPGRATGVAFAVATGIGLLVIVRDRRWRAALFLLVLLGAGVVVERRALDGLEHGAVARAARARAEVVATATLVEDPAGPRWSTRALARVTGIRRSRAERATAPTIREDRVVVFVAQGDAAGRVGVLAAGDEVVVRGWLRPLEGYDERYRWRHAAARLDVVELVSMTPSDGPLASVANQARSLVLRGTDLLDAHERALVAGFLLGDTRDLPKPVLDQFRDAGLSHLLAVSGANVAFVLALAGPLLRRTPRPIRVLATVGVLAVFGAMTRWEPSVVRACAMAAVTVLALHAGRPARGIRVLALAVTGLLVVDPFLLRSVGFLLSCGATAGIALFAMPIAQRLRGPAWLREALATTAAAQLGVAPVLLPVFGTLPLVSLPANLLAVPLAGPLTTWGLTAGAVAGFVHPSAPPLAAALQLPTELLAQGVLGIADVASAAPLAIDGRDAVLIVATVTLVVAPVALRRRRRRMLAERAMVVPTR